MFTFNESKRKITENSEFRKLKHDYSRQITNVLGDDHLNLRGGGGGLALLVGTDYLFSSRARPEHLYPVKSRTEYLFSIATIFLKSKKKKRGGVGVGGGWVVRGLSRGAGIGFPCFA